MKKIFNYLSIIAMLVFFAQCSKDESPIQQDLTNTKSNEIVSKNGRLIFKDSTALFKHVDWIIENQNNPEVIEEFNKEHGITSLNSVFQKGMDIENEEEFETYVKNHPNAFVKEYYEGDKFEELPCPNAILL